MRPRDRHLARRLRARLRWFDRHIRPMPGIHDPARFGAFLEQIVESIRRVKFVAVVRTRMLSPLRCDPSNELFDPLKAAIIHQCRGDVEEAFWLVFLFVHFGKHARGGWRYAREVYGRLGQRGRWDWVSTSSDPAGFRQWLDTHQNQLKRHGVPGGFGNHRKYESLDAYSANGTGAVVASYVAWVNPPRTHQELIQQACQQAGEDRRKSFEVLYQSMKVVTRFGRMARFDYLTMLGKLGLAPIEPGSTYLQGSTGPLDGARLLFGRDAPTKELDAWLVELDCRLGVGMQVLEDALCNWQKSPDRFQPFRG